MAEQEREFEELLAPAAVAKALGISVATLRKYSLIVEKVTANKKHYQRNKQKARLYSQEDLADLKAFHKLAKNHGLTLQEAARQVFAVSDKKEEDLKKEQQEAQQNAVLDTQQLGKLLSALQTTIASQNNAIQALEKQVSQITQQNKELLQNQKQLQAPQDKNDRIAAMPDISGVVTDDEEIPATPEEKRKQVEADSKKTREEVRQEIMAKSKENEEKRQASANVHRTLQDMQIPRKRHWWQRFLN